LQESSNGTAHGLEIEWEPEPGESILDKTPGHSAVLVWGGPWAFDACNLTCVGGTPLSVSVFGGAVMRACVLGGETGIERNAIEGVEARMYGKLVMHDCLVQNTGHLFGVGARAVDQGLVIMKGCDFHENDFAVGVNGNNGTIVLEGCNLEHQRMAAFFVGGEIGTNITVRRSRVRGYKFQDICFEKRNQTVIRAIRNGEYLMTPDQAVKDLYIQYNYIYR